MICIREVDFLHRFDNLSESVAPGLTVWRSSLKSASAVTGDCRAIPGERAHTNHPLAQAFERVVTRRCPHVPSIIGTGMRQVTEPVEIANGEPEGDRSLVRLSAPVERVR